MRPTFMRFGFILVSAAACTSHPPGPPDGGEIRVHGRPGATYPRTEGEFALMRLQSCPSPATNQVGLKKAAPSVPTVAQNAVGDRLQVAADAVPPNTDVKIERPTGTSYRRVDVSAGGLTPAATLTIDLRGCSLAPPLTIVRWNGAGWDDVGGTVSGTTITTNLSSLSIYAVAGS